MSIFSIVGRPEPQWAKNIKAGINNDNLPNPLKKTQSVDATATINAVKNETRIGSYIVIGVIILVVALGSRK